MDHDELLSILKEDKKVLPGVLEGSNREDFRRSFMSLFSCTEARNAKSVIYVWATVNPIPRLKSKSNVVYIGKTVTSVVRPTLLYFWPLLSKSVPLMRSIQRPADFDYDCRYSFL